MLNTIILTFILSVADGPDLYQPTIYMRANDETSCDYIDFIEPNLFMWGFSLKAANPQLDVSPSTLSYDCQEMDHADPDVQPTEDSA